MPGTPPLVEADVAVSSDSAHERSKDLEAESHVTQEKGPSTPSGTSAVWGAYLFAYISVLFMPAFVDILSCHVLVPPSSHGLHGAVQHVNQVPGL
jgi:hypothetical protein